MKLYTTISILLLICFSNMHVIAQVDKNQHKELVNSNTNAFLESFLGEYSGIFFKSELSIVLEHLTHGEVTGFDEHKGIRRPLKGTYALESGILKLILHEPGDHKYDGVITLQIDGSCFCGTGNWKSMKGKMEHPIEQLHKKTSLPTQQK